jgi:hypothetical protein
MSTKEKDKNLKNNEQDLDLIVKEIERLACHNNPGPTAELAVSFIDETYVLIPREELPAVTFGTLDDAYGGPQVGRILNITENIYEGDTDKMRKLAYQYLSMAEFVDEKKHKESEAKLNVLRAEAWNLLHPGSFMEAHEFHWLGCDKTEKNAINAIVELKLELAKVKEKS